MPKPPYKFKSNITNERLDQLEAGWKNAVTWDHGIICDRETCEGILELIAALRQAWAERDAAPDLLAVCKMLVAYLDGPTHIPSDWPTLTEIEPLARAAIAKTEK